MFCNWGEIMHVRTVYITVNLTFEGVHKTDVKTAAFRQTDNCCYYNLPRLTGV